MRKKALLVIGAMLVLFSVLSGCSDDTTSNDGDSKVLRMQLGADPTTFDPAHNGDFLTSALLRQMFDGLVRLDENSEPVESVASNIEVSDDKLTYTFTLRESEWSNGDPVTAHDFAYAWLRILNPDTGSSNADIFFLIKNAEAYYEGTGTVEEVGIKAVDDQTLEVTLEYPAPYFLELLTGSHYMPVNQKVVEGNDKWANDPSTLVSNGPFVLSSYKIKDEVVLEKNDKYWEKDVVNIDKVEYVLIEDNNTALDMFNTGKLDWVGAPVGSLPGDALKTLKDEGKLNSKPSAHASAIVYHMDMEPFTNTKIRQAFSYAINRQDLTEHVLQGGQKPALGLVPATMLLNPDGYFTDHNVEEAKKLLKEGMKELGISELPPITYLYISSENGHKIAQAVQAQLKEGLGVDIILESLEAKVFFDVQFADEKSHQFSFAGWTADYNDPIDFLQSYLVDDWESVAYDDLLKQAKVEPDPAKRDEFLFQAEKLMMDEMALIPLYSGANNWIHSEKVKGIYVTSISHYELKWADIE